MSYSLYKQVLAFIGVLLILSGCNMDSPSIENLGLKGQYVRQFGASRNDTTTGIATANSNIYVAVNIARTFQNGSVDEAWIYKYDSAGNFVEAKNPAGTPCCSYWSTYIRGMTSDKNGNIYVTGDFTDYTLKPEYAYIDKYDSGGTLVWTRKFTDTTVSYLGDPTRIHTNAISTDSRENVYVMVERSPWPYQTRNISIRKHNSRGGFLWESPIANVSSYAFKAILTTDASGNIYAAFASIHDYKETKVSIYKLDSQGNFLWSQSTEPSGVRTNIYGMVADTQGLYITGTTIGNLGSPNQGSLDAFIRKYDISGNVLWTKQFGTSTADWSNDIAVDPAGNVYVAGSTQGNLLITSKGNYDGFIRKYDPNGNALQARQFGTVAFDRVDKVTLDGNNNVYVAGSTQGNMQGINKGGLDVYIRKYAP